LPFPINPSPSPFFLTLALSFLPSLIISRSYLDVSSHLRYIKSFSYSTFSNSHSFRNSPFNASSLSSASKGQIHYFFSFLMTFFLRFFRPVIFSNYINILLRIFNSPSSCSKSSILYTLPTLVLDAEYRLTSS
jgi:hypothetical protein